MHIYQELNPIAARWGNSSKQFCFNKQFRWVKPEVSFDNKPVPTEQANNLFFLGVRFCTHI